MWRINFVSFDNGQTYHSDMPDDANIDRLDGIVGATGRMDFYRLVEESVPASIRNEVMETVNTPWWQADSFNPSDMLFEYMNTSPTPIIIDLTGRIGSERAQGAYEHVIDTRSPMGKPSAERPEVFCTIQWARDDIAAAIEDACDPSYDVELDRHGPQGEQVEALIDQVIDGIGSDLQDRSIAMGWSVIANFLPDEVIRQAAALGVPEEERNAHAEPASGHGPSMPRLADEAEASRTASDMLAGSSGSASRSPQQEK